VSASDIKISSGHSKTITGENVDHETPTPLTKDEIKETIQDFVRGARLAKEAGFDGVEIHSANGYLVDQFLQSCSNNRTDEYGGSFENRVRFLKEIVEAMIEEGSFPANRIGFRLSPNGNFGDMGSEDNYEMFPYIAKEMNKYGLGKSWQLQAVCCYRTRYFVAHTLLFFMYCAAYLHLMDGLGFGFHNKAKVVTSFDIKKNFDGPVIVNVGLTKDMGEGVLRSGTAELAAYGRPYIANPDLVERFQNDWPLHESASHETWWDPACKTKGFTDYKTYEPTAEEK
jgi:N-ethylmaleimide reductase